MKEVKKTLTVALRGMDSRTVKTMKLFFFGPCRGIADVVVNPDDAEIDIFDADIPTSKNTLDQFIHEQSSKPFIVLSVRDYKLENGFHVKKPVNTDSMLKVFELVRKQLTTIEKLNAKKGKSEMTSKDNAIKDVTGSLNKHSEEPKVLNVLKDVDDWFDF
jgi:hypothetical protein